MELFFSNEEKKDRLGQGRGTSVTVSRNVCYNLKNIYAPEGFNAQSTVLACGFPGNTTEIECRDFMSWIAPIVFVERVVSFGSEANFVIVFASDDQAQYVARQSYVYDDKLTEIVCRLVDERPTLWQSFLSSISSERSAGHRNIVLSNTGTPVRNYNNSTGNGAIESWNQLINNENVQKIKENVSQFGSQLMEQVESTYTQMSAKPN